MLLETGLRQQGFETQVLNASAGGWALENEAGWLCTHGLFGARILIIELGTHDLFQQFASGQIVGNHPSFPDRYPGLALIDVWSRYKSQILPMLRIGKLSAIAGPGGWASVQHASGFTSGRFDLGPSLLVRAPIGKASVELSADWRFQVAGNALPGSGPALTLSTGF